jgi:hypothetical protein
LNKFIYIAETKHELSTKQMGIMKNRLSLFHGNRRKDHNTFTIWHYGTYIPTSLCHRFSGRRGRDRVVFGFIITYAISAYHHWCCEFGSRSVCQWLATGRWFCSGPPIFSTNKIDRNDIAEQLLKVALSTIKQTNKRTTFLHIANTNRLYKFINLLIYR